MRNANAAHTVAASYDRYVSAYENVRAELAEYRTLRRMDSIAFGGMLTAMGAVATLGLAAFLGLAALSTAIAIAIAIPCAVIAAAFGRVWLSVAVPLAEAGMTLREEYGASAVPRLLAAYERHIRR